MKLDLPRVGSAIFVRRPSPEGPRILFHERRGAHGAGDWSVPGGGVEPGEAPPHTAWRELQEEAGIEVPIANVRALAGWSWTSFPENGQQWVTLYFLVDVDASTEAVVREPDRVGPDGWVWLTREELGDRPLFAALRETLTRGIDPWTVRVGPAAIP